MAEVLDTSSRLYRVLYYLLDIEFGDPLPLEYVVLAEHSPARAVEHAWWATRSTGAFLDVLDELDLPIDKTRDARDEAWRWLYAHPTDPAWDDAPKFVADYIRARVPCPSIETGAPVDSCSS